MPRITPVERLHLRNQHPHAARVQWYLAVAPYGDPCFTATVNDATILRGAMTIVYAGGVAANVFTEDYPDLTLWVGTAAGGRDLGTVRVRAVTGAPGAPPGAAGTLTVAENDDIAWVNGAHLTIPGDWGFRELWGVYQRIAEAGGAVTFYKDYDVAWAAADDVLPPKANAGPPVVAWIDPATGNADVDFIGSASYTTELGAAISGWSWDFADGAVIAGGLGAEGTRAAPNTVQWNTPGFRYVYLEVTDDTARARTQIVYVPVWIFQEEVKEPYATVEVLSQDAAPSWRARLKVTQTNTAAEDIIYHFTDGALVVLFTRTEYGGTAAAVGHWFGPADVQQGALTCDPGAISGLDDAGQNFADWDTVAPGTAAFTITCYDAGGDELCWGYCGDQAAGGTTIEVYQDAGLTTRGWADGACAGVVAYEVWEADVNTNYRGRSDVRFVGWLDGESLNFDHEAGTVEFDAIPHDAVLDRLPGFAYTLEDDATPADWYEMANLDVDRALHHHLLYQSTAANVCHVERAGEGAARPVKIQSFPDASVYQQAQEHLLKDAQCLLLSDRQGILRATRDPQMMSWADRAMVPVECTFTDPDWINEVEEAKPHRPEAGAVRLGGFQYAAALLSLAPGDAPEQDEDEARVEGCILQNQAEANRWSGQALAKLNNIYPDIPLELAGYWPCFDPAYQEYVWLAMVDPLNRVTWANEPLVVREVAFKDAPADATGVTELTLEMVVGWLDGETQSIPSSPAPGDPEWPMPPELEPPDVWEGPVKACIAYTEDQIAYTDDLLRHHVYSQGTAGTGGGGGLDLFDNTLDFVALEVAFGDVVENPDPASHARTTVAVVVGPNQLTLAADIGLGVGDWYHIGMPEWVDARGAIDTAVEEVLQIEYVRTGENSVGAWCLTDVGVWYTSNILTGSPGWACTLTLAYVQSLHADLAAVEFKGLGVQHWGDPAFCIVSFSETTCGDAADPCYGLIYTNSCGGSWTLSQIPNAMTPAGGGHGKCTQDAPFRAIAIDESGGTIYCIRGEGLTGAGLRLFVFISVDGGATFGAGTDFISQSTPKDSRADLYFPFGGGNLFATVQAPSDGITFDIALMLSADGGMTWTDVDPPGYGEVVGLVGGGGKTGVSGWYGNAGDYYAIYEEAATTHQHLLRNDVLIGVAGSDAGVIANEVFDGVGPWFDGSVAVAPHSWVPDSGVLVWCGVETANVPLRRIMYTPDNGDLNSHWLYKMGDWYDNPDLAIWSGAGGNSGMRGNVGCIPLPRVGSNA